MQPALFTNINYAANDQGRPPRCGPDHCPQTAGGLPSYPSASLPPETKSSRKRGRRVVFTFLSGSPHIRQDAISTFRRKGASKTLDNFFYKEKTNGKSRIGFVQLTSKGRSYFRGKHNKRALQGYFSVSVVFFFFLYTYQKTQLGLNFCSWVIIQVSTYAT